MEKQIWYGYSEKDNRVHFFNSDPGDNSSVGKLVGTGSFTVNGETTGLNIEQNAQQGSERRQTQPA